MPVIVCFRAPDPLQARPSEHRHILSRLLFQHEHICRPGHVPEWIISRHAEEAEMLDTAGDPTIHDPNMRRRKILAHTTRRTSRSENWQSLPGREHECSSR